MWKRRHDSGQAFMPRGRGVSADVFGKVRNQDRNRKIKDDGEGYTQLNLAEGKGIAFPMGSITVDSSDNRVTVYSPLGTYDIIAPFKLVQLEGVQVKDGEASTGIRKKFAVLRRDDTIEISSSFSGLKKLKKSEMGIPL